MAIVVEEEKGANNLLNIVGWLAIVVLVGLAIYYLFFVSPGSALILPTAGLNSVTPITSINFNVQDVVGSEEFKALKPYVSSTSPLGAAPVGRPNPFLAP